MIDLSNRISNCKLVQLERIQDERGNLTFIESERTIPFAVKRVYYIYEVADGATRGSHAHRNSCRFLVPISGSFDVHLDDGSSRCTFRLDRRQCGLLIVPMVWHVLDNFAPGSICLVLAGDYFDDSEYLRSYSDFLTAVKNGFA